MKDNDISTATAARGAYVTEVRQLVDDQIDVLFTMATAAAEQASTADQRINVTREARSLTAAVGERTAVLHIEAITDQPADVGRAWTFMTGQARCILPTPDGTTDEWVLALQRLGAGDRVARHTWVDAKARLPVTEAAMATTLRSFFP